MFTKQADSDRITVSTEEEGGMANQIRCPKCQEDGHLTIIQVRLDGNAEIKGIIKCYRDGLERPIVVGGSSYGGDILHIAQSLPDEQSTKLHSDVPNDIKEDVREAERASWSACYRASAAMCRRALQIGLIDSGIKDAPLEVMLEEAYNSKLLTDDTYIQAKSIRTYGNIAVHRKQQIDGHLIGTILYVLVEMLNEIFDPERQEIAKRKRNIKS
jgi:hypothetical protein